MLATIALAICMGVIAVMGVATFMLRAAYVAAERHGQELQALVAALQEERTKLYDLTATQQQLIHGWSTAAEAWRGTAVNLLGSMDPEAAETVKRSIAKADTSALLQRAAIGGSAR